MDKLFEFESTARSTESGADLGNLHMAGMSGGQRILIIDDDHGIADTLALIFSAHRYVARVAYSAEEAIELIAQWPPRVAIIDVMLPHMNGIDLAIVLKSNYPSCRTLLFSARQGHETRLVEALRRQHNSKFLPNWCRRLFCWKRFAGILWANTGENSSDA